MAWLNFKAPEGLVGKMEVVVLVGVLLVYALLSTSVVRGSKMALPVLGNLSGVLNFQAESCLAQRLPKALVEAIPALLGPVAEVLIREDHGGFFLFPTPVNP